MRWRESKWCTVRSIEGEEDEDVCLPLKDQPQGACNSTRKGPGVQKPWVGGKHTVEPRGKPSPQQAGTPLLLPRQAGPLSHVYIFTSVQKTSSQSEAPVDQAATCNQSWRMADRRIKPSVKNICSVARLPKVNRNKNNMPPIIHEDEIENK